MGTLWQDLKFGLRILLKQPLFSLVAILTLAIGIGANTALFSALHGIMFRSLPFSHTKRIMMVWSVSSNPNLSHLGFFNPSAPDYYDWVEQNTVFEELAAMSHRSLNLTDRDEPLALTGWAITANFFDVFEKPPLLGRGFLPEEIGPDKAQVVILSHSLWKQAYEGRSDILGYKITLDNKVYSIIGVAHPDIEFRQDFRIQFYIPFDLHPQQHRSNRSQWVVGRLKPGVTKAQAAAEMSAIAARLEEQYPDSNTNWNVKFTSLQERMFGKTQETLVVLYTAAGLVLLIACANVANLLLAQAANRYGEMAVRSALGADRQRLFRQMLLEGTLLSLLAGTLGFLGAYWGMDLMRYMVSVLGQSDGIAGLARITMSPWILTFAIVLSLGTTILFGLLPAWHASHTNPANVLRGSARGASQGIAHRQLSSLFVVAEISLAFVLLTGACLLLKSLDRLYRTSPGFQTAQLLTVQITLSSTSEYQRSRDRATFCHNVLEQIVSIPGVLSAASINRHPLGDNCSKGFTIAGSDTRAAGKRAHAEYRTVSAGYFSTMGIPILRGRYFTETDDGSHKVMIVDEEFVRRYFPNQNPIGLQIGGGRNPWEIIGVVGNIKSGRMTEIQRSPHMYEPIDQFCENNVTFMIKSVGEPIALVDAVRQAIWRVNSNQPIEHIQSMQDIINDSLSMRRLSTFILSLFAGTALILTLIGIYGVMAYSVNQRTREIGIRMAFGARGADVIKRIMLKGIVLTIVGLLTGLVVAFALCRAMSSLLYEVSTADLTTFTEVVTIVAMVALLACYIPARRAAKVDPMKALRYE